MDETRRDVLASAARAALRAPSLFNTQPWRWRVDAAGLELRADRGRWVAVVDPDDHMLLLSLGCALHHARVAIAAAGWVAGIERTPSDDVAARIRLQRRQPPGPEVQALHAAIARRRSDRRPFGNEPISAEALAALLRAAESEGVHVHRVGPDQLPMLAIAAAAAGASETADSAYRAELMHWTNRPEWSDDGVPIDTAVKQVPRRVPVRDFAMPPHEGMEIEPGGDRGAAYLIMYGTAEGPCDWLRGGEALSALLLTATVHGLSTAVISDVIEVEHSRNLVRGLLGGGGEPYVVIRCGRGAAGDVPDAPRRAPDEVIDGLPLI
jgi:nitroreductase